MTVPSLALVADLAAFFDVTGFGVAGVYTQGSVNTNVVVIQDAPQEFSDIGGARLSSDQFLWLLRADVIAAPAEGDVLTIAGVSHRINAAPRHHDRARLIWRLSTD